MLNSSHSSAGRPSDRAMILLFLARALMGDEKIVDAEAKCQE